MNGFFLSNNFNANHQMNRCWIAIIQRMILAQQHQKTKNEIQKIDYRTEIY